jgi:hypothetical protein
LGLNPHTIWPVCISWWNCFGWMFNEVYFHCTALIAIIHHHHLTVGCLQDSYDTFYGPPNLPECGISLMSWCSVSSSGHAGLLFLPLQRAGGDHSLCFHNHWVYCLIAMFVELRFDPDGQTVQMPCAAYSLPRFSQLYCMVCCCES